MGKLSNGGKILLVGFATFFFGFGAGAILNYYLILIDSPLILHLRGALSYRSAIFGDGLLIPIINMIVAYFLIKYSVSITTKEKLMAVFIGCLITAYFHISQAMEGLINWAMPIPWQWNLLGLWHGIYMLIVALFNSLFYLVALKNIKKKAVWLFVALISLGWILFFVLLGLDYN